MTRKGRPCRCPAVLDQLGNARNGRCKHHGGLSTGPITDEGRKRISDSNRRRAIVRDLACLEPGADQVELEQWSRAVVPLSDYGLAAVRQSVNAAEAAGVSIATVEQWMQRPGFAAVVSIAGARYKASHLAALAKERRRHERRELFLELGLPVSWASVPHSRLSYEQMVQIWSAASFYELRTLGLA